MYIFLEKEAKLFANSGDPDQQALYHHHTTNNYNTVDSLYRENAISPLFHNIFYLLLDFHV